MENDPGIVDSTWTPLNKMQPGEPMDKRRVQSRSKNAFLLVEQAEKEWLDTTEISQILEMLKDVLRFSAQKYRQTEEQHRITVELCLIPICCKTSKQRRSKCSQRL